MKFLRFLILNSAFLILAAGCATPHRSTLTTHTREEFRGRADGLIERETWRDKDSGGAMFLFVDPTSQGLTITHTNQSALGGESRMKLGPSSAVVDTNVVPAITAGGTAIGNIIGAAAKSAVK